MIYVFFKFSENLRKSSEVFGKLRKFLENFGNGSKIIFRCFYGVFKILIFLILSVAYRRICSGNLGLWLYFSTHGIKYSVISGENEGTEKGHSQSMLCDKSTPPKSKKANFDLMWLVSKVRRALGVSFVDESDFQKYGN